MRRSKASRKYYLAGLLATLLLTCLIVAGVLLVCHKTAPGKIVPSELTGRFNKFDEDIIGKTSIEAADCKAFKKGALDQQLLLDDYIDPFFFMGALLPDDVIENFFLAVYVLKIGLAAMAMYSFLRRRIALKRTFAIVMGMTYALSSRVIFISSLSQAMNVVILMPLAMSVIYSAARKKTVRSFIMLGITAFVMCVLGTAGTLSGTLFIISASLIISFALVIKTREALALWGKMIISVLSGVSCALFLIVPRFMAYGMTYDFKRLIEDRKVYYSFFDMLSTMFSGSGGSLDYSAVPTVYFGLFSLMLFILFFFNKKIPAKLKFLTLLLLALTHIACAVSVVDLTLSFFGYSSVITDLRLIGLLAVICFLDAICLVNLDGISDTGVITAGLSPIFAMILFNGLGGAVSYNITSMYLPGAVLIILSLIFYRKRKDFLPRKYLYPFLIAGLLFISFNTFVTFATGSVEPGDVKASFVKDAEQDGMALISDEEISIFNSDEDKYLIVPEHDTNLLDPSILPVFLNTVSKSVCGDPLFVKTDYSVISNEGISVDGDGYFTADSDTATLVIGADKASGKKLYVYCGFDGSNFLEEDDGESVGSIDLDGAYLKQITRFGNHVEITLGVDDRETVTAPIEVLLLDQDVLELLQEKTGLREGKSFTVPSDFAQEGANYLLTNIPYDKDYNVYINGDKELSLQIQGMLAARFDKASDGKDITVTIAKGPQGTLLGGSLSLLALAVSIAIAVAGIADERKRERQKAAGT